MVVRREKVGTLTLTKFEVFEILMCKEKGSAYPGIVSMSLLQSRRHELSGKVATHSEDEEITILELKCFNILLHVRNK